MITACLSSTFPKDAWPIFIKFLMKLPSVTNFDGKLFAYNSRDVKSTQLVYKGPGKCLVSAAEF